jgi:hypothetical protein
VDSLVLHVAPILAPSHPRRADHVLGHDRPGPIAERLASSTVIPCQLALNSGQVSFVDWHHAIVRTPSSFGQQTANARRSGTRRSLLADGTAPTGRSFGTLCTWSGSWSGRCPSRRVAEVAISRPPAPVPDWAPDASLKPQERGSMSIGVAASCVQPGPRSPRCTRAESARRCHHRSRGCQR